MNRSKQAGMGRKAIVVWLVALALAPFRLVEAEQPAKVHRIGYMSLQSLGSEPARIRIEACAVPSRQGN
jgi:hypothetical protein